MVIIDIVDIPRLEVDALYLPELSVGSKRAVGLTDSVVRINQADSFLSKEGRVLVPVISARDEDRKAIVIGRSMCCSQNDPS